MTIYFTDSSKTVEGVGISIINKSFTTVFKLPESCSNYTAEAIAILEPFSHMGKFIIIIKFPQPPSKTSIHHIHSKANTT